MTCLNRCVRMVGSILSLTPVQGGSTIQKLKPVVMDGLITSLLRTHSPAVALVKRMMPVSTYVAAMGICKLPLQVCTPSVAIVSPMMLELMLAVMVRSYQSHTHQLSVVAVDRHTIATGRYVVVASYNHVERTGPNAVKNKPMILYSKFVVEVSCMTECMGIRPSAVVTRHTHQHLLYVAEIRLPTENNNFLKKKMNNL